MKKRLLLLIIIGVLVGSTLEAAARLILRYRVVEPVVPAGIGRFDERLGWALTPLSHGTSRRTGYEVEYRINSKGLRSRETTYKKPEDTFRIVLLGDSRTFGFGVPIEKHFSTLLEGYFRDVEVIDMGVGGFGVDQELLYLNYEGFRYEPDMVLEYVPHYGGNRHMHTERWGKSKPRFKLVEGKLVLINSPVVRISTLSSTPSKVGRWLSVHSAAYIVLKAGLAGFKGQEHHTIAEDKKEDEKDLQYEAFRRELYKLGEAIVYAMQEESAKHGAAFVLVTQIKPLYEAAVKRRMSSLDVLEPLSNEKFALPAGLEHINESGNGVLAWEIAKFLKANKLIPASHLRPARDSRL
jgi:hypothetical protein